MLDQLAKGRRSLGFLAALALSAAVPFGIADGQEPKEKRFQEYSQSFKGTPKNRDGLELFGPDAGECVRYEPLGLRISLPPGHPVVRPETGLRVQVGMKGDFEITVNFELLGEPDPKDTGSGTRTTLRILLATPDKNRNAALSRALNAQGVTQFTAWAPALDDGAKIQRIAHSRTAAKTGRLRLVRTGADVSYYASEGVDGELVFLKKYTLSDADVKEVRLVGTTGGPKAALDVRMTDLLIRAEALPNLPDAAAQNPAPQGGPGVAAPRAETKGWLAAGLALGLVITLLLAAVLGMWLWIRKRGAVENPVAVHQAEPNAVVVTCSTCGKKLKTRVELAGKKVKCPHCGEPAVVPQSAADEAHDVSS